MESKIYNFYTLSASSDVNNVRYVGVTTKKVTERFCGHKYCALHPEKRELPVHKWMWKHYELGEDIIVKQIDSCEESDWETREQLWIQYYKDGGYLLTNISKGGNGVITKEMRSKTSIQRSIEGHQKAIIALNKKDGSFVKQYESIKKAAEELGLKSISAIGNVLTGRSKSSAGYMWIYADDYDENKEYSYNPIHKGNYVYEFDIDGILLNTYPSLRSFEKLKGWSANGVTSAIKNKTVYHDHYWSLEKSININDYESYFNYSEVDSLGNVLNYYRTQQEIANRYNITNSWVCVAIKEHKEIAPGKFITKL